MEEEEEEEETTLKRKAPKKSKNNDLLDSMKDFGQEEDIMEEDDFYEKVKSMKDQKKKDKLKAKQEEEEEWTGFGEEGEDENDGRRVATNQILKNRGLTPKRNKEIKNPRVKRRMKFEKASKKLKHIVPQAKSKGQPYQGELTGIKPNLSKSVRIK
jgi:U3 small nucleolar RNA-associated protein 3